MPKPIPPLSINVDQASCSDTTTLPALLSASHILSTSKSTLMMYEDAALGNLTPASSTCYSPQQEFTQVERFGPATLPSPGYEIFSFPDQAFRGTARTPPKPVSRIILCRNYTRRGRCSFGVSCKFFHDPALSTVSGQWKKRRDRVSNCDYCPQGMHRFRSSSTDPHSEKPLPCTRYLNLDSRQQERLTIK